MNREPIEILLVEDEEAHAEAIRLSFRSRADWTRFTTVSTIREARNYLAEAAPNLILLDWKLPDGTALDLLPGEKEVPLYPIVVMTSHGTQQIAVQSLKAGALDYVVKSDSSFAEIPHVVDRTLREWRHIQDKNAAQLETARAKQQWEKTFDAVPDLVALIDEKHRFVRVNKALADKLGISAQEAVGKTCYKLIHESDCPPESCPHARLMKDGKEHSTETCERKLGGTWLITASPFLDEQGVLTGGVHVSRDITPMKEAEEKLRRNKVELEKQNEDLRRTQTQLEKSRDAYSDLYDFAPVGYFTLDTQGIIHEINVAGSSLLGLEKHSAIGKPFSTWIDQADADSFALYLNRVFETRSKQSFEVKLVPTDRNELHAKLETVIEHTSDDRSARCRMIASDVTDLKMAEQALRLERDLLNAANKRLSAARHISDLALRDLPISIALQEIVEEISDAVDFPVVTVELYDETRRKMVLRTSTGIPFSETHELTEFDATKTLSGVAVHTREPVIETYARESKHIKHETLHDMSAQTVLCFPMIVGGRVLGTLTLAHPEALVPGDDLVQWLNGTVNSVASFVGRRQAEELWRLTQYAIDNVGISAFCIDRTGRIVYANNQACRSLGYSPQEMYSVAVSDFDPEITDDDWLRYFRQRGGRKSEIFERIHRTKDGRIFPVEINSNYFEFAGKEYHWTFATDITERLRTQQEIQDKNTFLSSLLEAVTHPFYVIDVHDYTITMANSAARDTFSPGGTTCYALTHGRDLPCHSSRYPCPIEELKRTLQPTTLEHVHLDRDGNPRHIEVFAYPILSADKEVTHVIEYAVDITERKHQEQLLEERTKDLAERVKELDCLYEISRLLGTGIESLDHTLSKLIEMIPSGFQQPESTVVRLVLDDREFTSPGFPSEASAMESPIFIAGIQRGYIQAGLQKDGLTAPDKAFLSEERELLSSIAATLGLAIERHESAKRLKEQLDFQRSLMDSMPGPVFYKDSDQTYRGCNKAFTDFFGLSREEVVGKRAHDFMGKEIADILASQDEQLLKSPGDRTNEVSMVRADGSLRDVVVREATFNDSDGNLAGIIGGFVDVTDTKDIEKQLRKAQKLESIATLAGGIAHDFNNLLTIIAGYAEMGMANKKQGDPGRDELAIVLDAAGRGADLVKQILTFSSEVESRPKPTNLNHQVERSRELLYKTIPKMIEIRTELADDLRIVMADPTQVEQIILNLAVNARDAMPEGGKLLFRTENCFLDENYCRLHADVQPGDYVALTISDTGQGMERQVLDRIFEPFFSTKETGKGTGLGLAMVFGIVKQHQGHMTCYSEPGVGTTFRIYFPTLTAGTTVPDLSSADTLPPLGKETILLVDDEELIADLGKRILTQRGYTVLSAANGREALEIYRNEQSAISLVILDMIMPEMDGEECLQQLLDIDPDVKVLVASGYAAGGRPEEAIARGAKGFVGKPFVMVQLLNMVRAVLDQS